MDDVEKLEASRGKFLAAAGLTGAALATGAWKTRTAGAADARSYVSGYFALELGGASTGFLKSIDGGSIRGEVVNEPGSATYYQKKHIGNVKYGEFTAELGLSMSKSVYDWISSSLAGSYERKSGAIVAADFKLVEQARREFEDALLTEIGFPALDASSKDVASLTIKIAPDRITRKKPSGATTSAPSPAKQKKWLQSNFRFTLGDLPTQRINKIDAITVKQTAVTDDLGDARDYLKEPGKLEFPNVTITFAAADAPAWEAWHEDFVVNGNNEEGKEKSGTIVFLSADLQEPLAHIELHQVGIVSVEPERQDASQEAIRRMKAELYCERMTFQLGGPKLE